MLQQKEPKTEKMVACGQVLGGALAAEQEREGELAITSLEFEFQLHFPCGSPLNELSDFRQSTRKERKDFSILTVWLNISTVSTFLNICELLECLLGILPRGNNRYILYASNYLHHTLKQTSGAVGYIKRAASLGQSFTSKLGVVHHFRCLHIA